MNNTTLFDVKELEEANMKMILKEVKDILEERGYNSVNQIVGYLLSGDPGYISSYKDARLKITEFDRTELLAAIIKDYLKWDI